MHGLGAEESKTDRYTALTQPQAQFHSVVKYSTATDVGGVMEMVCDAV